MDPQGNLTMSLGLDPDSVRPSMYDVLVNGVNIEEALLRRELDVVVSSIDLAAAEIALSSQIGRERALSKALMQVTDRYDYIVIDTPPVSRAADHQRAHRGGRGDRAGAMRVSLSARPGPAREDPRAGAGRTSILACTSPASCPRCTIPGRSTAGRRSRCSGSNFGDLVFQTPIRKTIKFAEAPVKGESVLKYAPDSQAANAYRQLAREVLSGKKI